MIKTGRIYGLWKKAPVRFLLDAFLGVVFIFAMNVAAIAADSSVMETTCVFPFALGNKPNYRIPAIVQAPNGDILVVCEKRNDGIGDYH